MKSSKKGLIAIRALLLVSVVSGRAHAIPSADLTYLEADLGGGLWEYSQISPAKPEVCKCELLKGA